MPVNKIFFVIRTPFRIDGRLSNWIWRTSVSCNCRKNGRIGIVLLCNSITQSQRFMPVSKIFVVMQTSFRIDGQPPNWILSTKDSRNCLENGQIGTVLLVQLYYPEPEVHARELIIFLNETPFRIDSRPPNWILSTEVSRNCQENNRIGTVLFEQLYYPEPEVHASE
jgi:hypothetical protein